MHGGVGGGGARPTPTPFSLPARSRNGAQRQAGALAIDNGDRSVIRVGQR